MLISFGSSAVALLRIDDDGTIYNAYNMQSDEIRSGIYSQRGVDIFLLFGK